MNFFIFVMRPSEAASTLQAILSKFHGVLQHTASIGDWFKGNSSYSWELWFLKT